MKKNIPPKKERKKPETRSRWLQFVLYPENRYHMQYLEWCKYHEYGFYIVHDEEQHHARPECGFVSEQKEDKKKHIHCAIYFENARTASSFIKSLGTCQYWVVSENEDGEPTMLSSVPLEFENERTIIKRFIEHAEAINDINAVAHYFLHDNFECHMLGKKQYNRSDVKMFHNDRSVFDRYFSDEMPTNNGTVETLIEFWRASEGSKENFLSMILSSGDTRLLKYVECRGFFVNEFICGGIKK